MQVFIIDISGLMFRAFYAVPNLSKKDGTPVNMVFGLLNMFWKLLPQLKGNKVIVAQDSSRVTFRTQLFPEYKNNRKALPEEFIKQLPLIEELLEALGFVKLAVLGYEADDIIATCLCKLDDPVVLVTHDKDLWQLIDVGVRVFDPAKEKFIGSAEVMEKFGVYPEKLLDLLALTGDSSDNIPGAPGIGPKTAAELLNQFGDLDNLLINLDQVKQNKRRQILEQAKDQILLSKKLVQLVADVPLNNDALANIMWQPDFVRLKEFCQKHEFHSYLNKIQDLVNLHQQEQRQSIYANSKFPSVFQEIFTTAANPNKANFLLDWRLPLRIALERPGAIALELMAALVIGPGTGYDQALDFFQITDSEFAKFWLYLELSQALFDQKQNRAYHRIDRPFLPVIYAMEQVGVKYDRIFLEEFGNNLYKQINHIVEFINQIHGSPINLDSPQQLSDFLFNKLGFPGTKKGKEGFFLTNDAILDELPDSPVIEALRRYRFLTKLQRTYVEGFLAKINSKDSRVYGQWSMTSTNTGRLSSSKPNLQNLPIRNDEAKILRNAVIPEDGFVLMAVDYSQIELRIFAKMARVQGFLAAFSRDIDIHSQTARNIFGHDDANFRRKAKAINFGILYGISAFGLANYLKIPVGEAKDYLTRYFAQYPEVKDYIERVDSVESRTFYGRICRSDAPNVQSQKRQMINAPIQGTSADIMKIAMRGIFDLLHNKYKSRIIMQIHDEIVLEIANEELDFLQEKIPQLMIEAGKDFALQVTVSVGQKYGSMERLR